MFVYKSHESVPLGESLHIHLVNSVVLMKHLENHHLLIEERKISDGLIHKVIRGRYQMDVKEQASNVLDFDVYLSQSLTYFVNFD